MEDRDLRSFISTLEEVGELRRISAEVDWNLELSHIAKVNEERQGPALLFTRVKDCSIPVMSSLLSTPKRLALALNMPASWSMVQMGKEWAGRCQRRIPPVEAKGHAPCKEVVKRGSEVDLYRFPALQFYPHDGGRYLGTLCTWVTKDPETGWVNLGMYRLQVLDERTLGGYVVQGKHAELHLRKYAERGEPMPVAVIIGCDPILSLCSGASFGYGEPEYDFAGALRGFPVPVVRGEVVDLPLPAHAEIVLEGHIWPGRFKPEGPFGEFTGYYTGGQREGMAPSPKEYIEVECLTHRRDPIFTITTVGRPVTDDHMMLSLFRSAGLYRDLEAMRLPGIQGVYIPPEACGTFVAIVSVKQMYPGHAKQVGNAVLGSASGSYGVKIAIIVDEDIPPDDLAKVWWALSVRCDPQRSALILTGQRSSPLDASLPVEARYLTSKMIIDATIPFEWREKPRVVELSPEVLERVLSRWKEFGLEG